MWAFSLLKSALYDAVEICYNIINATNRLLLVRVIAVKYYILFALVVCLLFSGCTVAEPEVMESTAPETTANPLETWDPFVGGFEYSAGRIFLDAVDGGEKIDYNISYRHKDETIEILEKDVSRYTTWKLVDQRLYFASWDNLYAKDLPDGELTHLVIDRQKYVRVSSILDMQDDQLLCGAQKWEQTTDSASSTGQYPVDTQIWVKLDFSEYCENIDFLDKP